MPGGDILLLGTHRFNIESDKLAAFAIIVFIENAYLIERSSQIYGAETLILVEFQAVLVVQMDGKQLVVCEGKTHFIRRIEPGKNYVSSLDIDSDPLGLVRHVTDGNSMPGRRNICLVHRLIRLRLNCNIDIGF